MEINYPYWVQVLAVSGIFSLYHFLCLRQNGKHQLNRFVLLGSIGLSLLLPLLHISIAVSGRFEVPLSLERAIVPNTSPAEAGSMPNMDGLPTFSNNILDILPVIFGVVGAFFLFRLLYSLHGLMNKIRRSKPSLHQHYKVIYHADNHQPFSFFRWIFLPISMQNDKEMLSTVLAHESTHARQWHSLDRLLTNLLKAVLWWNPFFYYLEKQLLLTHEYLADASAAEHTGIKQYAALLIHHIFPGSPSFITHSFYQSPIKSRIMMLITPSTKPSLQWIFIPLIGLSLLIFSTSFKKTPLPASPEKILNVVVDAGHGGMDNGATSTELKEKDLALALAKAIKQKSLGTNINITLTRNEDELPVAGNINESLKRRVDLVRETDADAMISLHIGTSAEANGTYSNGVRAFVAGKNEQNAIKSKPLATALLNRLTGGPLFVQPEIQQRREQGIYILDKNPKPVVLLEVGFITSKKDLEVLSNADGIGNLAELILKGLKDYSGRE